VYVIPREVAKHEFQPRRRHAKPEILRVSQRTPRLREIDSARYPTCRCRARRCAGTPQSGRAHPQMQEGEALFEIHDAPWQLASIEKLASHERPDPAFRLLYPVDSGLLMFDDLATRGLRSHPSAALR